MARQTLNIGQQPNDGTGDPLRGAFEKVEGNFIELYNALSNPAAFSASREEFSFTTSNLSDGDSQNIDIQAYKGYVVYKIEVSHACFLRIYTGAAERAVDSLRTSPVYLDLQSGFPENGTSGLIGEFITAGAQTIKISPAIIGFNNEDPITNIIPIRITNLSGSDTEIDVVLTLLSLEN